MARLYDNDAHREEFMALVYDELSEDPTNDRANRIIDAYDSAPTIDPVRHARWDINKSPSGIVTHRCTNCRCEPPRRSWRAKPYAFCPDCGARMDLEEENDG